MDEKYIINRYSQNKRTPVFVDLSNIAYRSAFVFTPDKFKTSQGIPNGHLFGICQNIKTLLTLNYEVYLCRDLKSTFRSKINESYKANRHTEEGSISIHESLNVAINPLISKLHNVHVISSEGYEADDVMFSAAKVCSENKIKCFILSTDKDMCQSLDDYISIAHKFTLKGPQEVVTEDSDYYKKNFEGVKPEALPFYRAFKGDASDNLDAPVKRFPKDLLLELCNEFYEAYTHKSIVNILLNHKCSKKSHEKWMNMLVSTENNAEVFTNLYNNFRIMKLNKIPINIENEALVDEAFNIITEKYELWGFRKFVKEYNMMEVEI